MHGVNFLGFGLSCWFPNRCLGAQSSPLVMVSLFRSISPTRDSLTFATSVVGWGIVIRNVSVLSTLLILLARSFSHMVCGFTWVGMVIEVQWVNNETKLLSHMF